LIDRPHLFSPFSSTMRATHFLFLVLLSSSALLVFAQDAETAETEAAQNETAAEEPVLVASPNARTIVVFPASQEKAFVLGKKIDVVVGFENVGKIPFTVSTISASLRYPPDWEVHIQNYTVRSYNLTIPAGEQASFHYSFRPDPSLDARPFGVAANIFYSDRDDNYTTLFFNDTIYLVEHQEEVDIRAWFIYIGAAAAVGLVGFLVYNAVGGGKPKKRKIEYGTANGETDADSWLAGTSADPRKRTGGSKSPRSSRKNQ